MSAVKIVSSRQALSVCLLVLACAACANEPRPPEPEPASPIRFAAAIPAPPEGLQLYTLAATRAPIEILNEKLGAAKLPTLKLEKGGYAARRKRNQSDPASTRAYVDKVSGDTYFTPDFAQLVRATTAPAAALERAQNSARSMLGDARFIPQDATQLRFGEPIHVMAGATEQSSAPMRRIEPKTMLTIVPAVRYAAGLRVYGLGSHAVVSVASDGTVVGALRRWRTASPGDRVEVHMSREQVAAEIERQLRPLIAGKGTTATVDKIDVAYYDGNSKYLQPVYRFEATVRPGNEHVAPIRVAGYLPIGKVLEPIPDLTVRGEPPTVAPSQNQGHNAPGAATAGDFTLGEYANRDWPNDGGYVSMANAFLNGLTFFNSIFPGLTPPVTRTQWYEAWPWEVVGPASRSFMNAVNVAYTVPHGDWLLNTTLANYGDLWVVSDIGTGGNPGFGHAAGGVLATWIIMSCEVIPSMSDRQREAGAADNPYTAFDAWWPVFQGLHNAIGFRTIMFYPDTDLQFGFGLDASLGGDVNAAWFQEVAANHGDDGTYPDQHLIGKPLVHYDRASTMIDARNLGQSIHSVGPQGASTTLWNFWMND